jgi:hypothetical protein
VVVAGWRDEAGKALVEELRVFGSEAEFINAELIIYPDANHGAHFQYPTGS